MKKVTDLGEKECIHCKTEEEAKAICTLMHKAGLRWRDGGSYAEENEYRDSKDRTCYYPYAGEFTPVGYYESENFTIYPASDFLPKPSKRHTYSKQFLRDDGVLFESDAIGGRSIEAIQKSIQERKDSIAADESLLRSHRILFSKKTSVTVSHGLGTTAKSVKTISIK